MLVVMGGYTEEPNSKVEVFDLSQSNDTTKCEVAEFPEFHFHVNGQAATLDDQILDDLCVLGIVWLGDFGLQAFQGLVHELLHQFVPVVHGFHAVFVDLS